MSVSEELRRSRQRSFLDASTDPGWRRQANAAARRADGARRLPPYVARPTGDELVDRDPLAAINRRTLTIEVGKHTVWISGYGAVDLLNRIGSPRHWDARRRQWMCPVDRAGDLVALAEHADKRAFIVVTSIGDRDAAGAPGAVAGRRRLGGVPVRAARRPGHPVVPCPADDT